MGALTKFVTDLFVRGLSESEMRKRWKDGDYTGVSADHAKGYFKLRGIGK